MTPPFLTSDLLSAVPGVSHGFFTRQGGVSTGVYESLNVGFGSDDIRDNVAENRARVAQALGARDLQTVYQVHSARVVTAEATAEEADGLVTTGTGNAIGVLTADCVPVLIAAKDGSKIAAVHAGWKGATQGILAAAVTHFNGTKLIAAIGPAIAQDSYQVGQEVYEAAGKTDFFKTDAAPGKYLFDLPGLVKAALFDAGVREIDLLHEDTYAQADRFFSYRRTTHQKQKDYGRQISAIVRR